MEEKLKLPKNIFGVRVNPVLMAQSVRVYLSNQRKAKAKTKTRAEVAKTTAKMYKQKGTGRARHGAYSAPIFVGGGIAHGPTGTQNYHRKMSKAGKRAALLSALSDRAAGKNVHVISDSSKFSKTKQAGDWLLKEKLSGGKILLVAVDKQTGLVRAFRNLTGVAVTRPENLSAYLILKFPQLVITPEAIAEIMKKIC
jgi:large subunit ribosomal protein L4